MGSARKVLVERLTFEQQPERAGLSGGRAGQSAGRVCVKAPGRSTPPMSEERPEGPRSLSGLSCRIL